MSFRTTRGLLFASSLALGIAAVGCGDDDKTPMGDDDMDAGAGDSGKPDATRPDGMVMANGDMMCGAEVCTGIAISGNPISACCVPSGGCGLNADDIKKISPQSQFTGCIPKDTPAAVENSTHCGAFFDQVEPDPMGTAEQIAAAHSNGGLDVAGTIPLVFDGCCLPSGECGAMLSKPRGAAGDIVNLHFGCVSLTALQSSLGSGGMSRPAPTLAPYCSPTTGNVECPSKMGLLCDSLKARGLPVTCTAETPTPSWACVLAKLPRNDQPVTVTEACFEGLPFAAQGCGETVATAPEGVSCIPGLPANKFGCGARPAATGPVFPAAPTFVCGCGENVGPTASSGPCIPNVAPTVCGSAAPKADELAKVPNFVCGCGETKALGATETLCLGYTPTSVCGTKAVTVANNCMVGLPEYAIGCGDTTPSATNRCIPGVARVFGCDAVSSGTVRGVPDYICGCGDGVPTSPVASFPCISNVPKAVCGAVPETANPVPNVPEYICGCGEGATWSNVGTPCLANKANTVCGAVDTAVSTRLIGTGGSAQTIKCLVSVPEYAVGCGDGTAGQPTSASDSCLRQAGDPAAPSERLTGCAEVTTSPANLFNYLCGCGDETPYLGAPNLPCLSFVPTSVCGSVPVVSRQQLPFFPNHVCGCGSTPASTCLKNVDTAICGAIASCARAGNPNTTPAECAAAGANGTCVDTPLPGTTAGDGVTNACSVP